MINTPSQTTTNKPTTVAAYKLNYLKGTVYSIGIYSDDVIHNPKFDKYLDDLLTQITQHKIVATQAASAIHT